MSIGPFDDAAGHERLSALLDGEVDGPSAASCCASWRAETEARHDWHAWHLIGDVLRSDELAGDPAHDAAFLASLRDRLAGEPVVLAPLPQRAGARSARWLVPSAVAAGFVLVVGTFVALRPGEAPSAPPASLALAGGVSRVAAAPLADAAPAPVTGEAQAVAVTDQKIVRDAQLERYLAAHKQFSGSSALGVPSAFLRSATLESPAR